MRTIIGNRPERRDRLTVAEARSARYARCWTAIPLGTRALPIVASWITKLKTQRQVSFHGSSI
jgi:hypothetical protein